MSQRWYHAITIDHTKVPADVTSGTFTLTAAYFNDDVKTLGGAQSPDSTGKDIRFYSDSGLTTQLAFDIITFTQNATPANADIEINVNASLSSASDTTIYVGWGDTSLSLLPASDTYGQYNAYKAGFKLWCPMKDDPDTSHVKDRTTNALSGAKAGTANPATGSTSPYIDAYQSFVRANSSYIEFPIITTGSQFIVFAPFNYTGVGPNNDRIVSCKSIYNQASGFEITLGGSGNTGIVVTSSGANYWTPNVFTNVVTDGWETLAVRFNNTAGDIFVNSVKTTGGVLSSVSTSSSKFQVGYNAGHNDSPISANIDNVIIYVGTLTDGEIQAMQNNQRSPGTFVKTVGATQNASGYGNWFLLQMKNELYNGNICSINR